MTVITVSEQSVKIYQQVKIDRPVLSIRHSNVFLTVEVSCMLKEVVKLLIWYFGGLAVEEESWQNKNFLFIIFILFYLYIYPPDSQESDGGANT